MMIQLDVGIDQGGFGAADGPSHQLTVLRGAGSDMMVLQDAGIDPNSPEHKFSRWIQDS